ncbi:MAG: hypothetical protein ACYSX0_00810 [Planctomycetota bacterium]|jgi:hypothetical protein
MRKVVLPLLVLAAMIGVVAVLIYSANEKETGEGTEKTEVRTGSGTGGRTDTVPAQPVLKKRQTRTKLSEHKWLSELERALARPDKSNAYFFRSKVCENLEEIGESEYLSGNLLALIRQYGIESDDPKARDVVLPILRVFEDPRATDLIRAAYPGARTEADQMILLEALSHEYHDPTLASEWAAEKALTASSDEIRMRAFELVVTNSRNVEVAYRTARKIYDETTLENQRIFMLGQISAMAVASDDARAFVRANLQTTRGDELMMLLSDIHSWGEEKDILLLERLAAEHPGKGDQIRGRATELRRTMNERKGLTPEGDPLPPDAPKPPPEFPPDQAPPGPK